MFKFFKNLNRFKIVMIFAFIFGCALLRLLPHPWNFTPIAAMALFGGVYINKKYALIVPLLAMLVSDYFLGFYEWRLMLAVYGSFLLVGLIGIWLKNQKNLLNIAGASLTGSILFFLITNFAVWAFSSWYTKDFSGLIYCYTLALPFFRNTLMGDLFYAGALFGAYETVLILVKNRQSIAEKVVAEKV